MKKFRYLFLSAAIGLMSFTSCSSDNDDDPTPDNQEDIVIIDVAHVGNTDNVILHNLSLEITGSNASNMNVEAQGFQWSDVQRSGEKATFYYDGSLPQKFLILMDKPIKSATLKAETTPIENPTSEDVLSVNVSYTQSRYDQSPNIELFEQTNGTITSTFTVKK